MTLAKAAELGYDQTKRRIPSATIKEESLEASPNVKNRSTKKSIKTPEENLQILYNFIREYRVEKKLRSFRQFFSDRIVSFLGK